MTQVMTAAAGDWLVVESGSDSDHVRTAEILGVREPGGYPPFRVRWLDDGRETLVFPGPDARVVSAEAAAQRRAVSARR